MSSYTIRSINVDNVECPTCETCEFHRGPLFEELKWDCLAEQNILWTFPNILSGGTIPIRKAKSTCIEARRDESACGLSGRWYKLYEKTPHSFQPVTYESDLQVRDIDTIKGVETPIFRKVSKRKLTDDDLNNL